MGDTCNGENSRAINSHTSDTNPFLHDLEPNDELHATTSVELARSDTEKHMEVRVPLCSLAFEFSGVADILEFSLSSAQISTGLSSKASENVTSFFFAANFDEPSRGLRKSPDDDEEEDEWNDLEGNGESPDEGRRPVTVE